MDTMLQAYMEETDELIQKAETCIIKLELEYSSVEINELFRIAHTIKGSSHMVGYEDIGNLMHKVEDMLDLSRKGVIVFDQSIVSLCFEGMDTVKKMLRYKREPDIKHDMSHLTEAASRINELIAAFTRVNMKEEKKVVVSQPATGIVSSLIKKNPKGKNKFFVTFFLEEDTPMVSPVLMMVLQGIREVGSLLYASVQDDYFAGSDNQDVNTLDVIIKTDVDEAALYTYFSILYIEKINIVDLSRRKLEDHDMNFNDNECNVYAAFLEALLKLYQLLMDVLINDDITSHHMQLIRESCDVVTTVSQGVKNKQIGFIAQEINVLCSSSRFCSDRHDKILNGNSGTKIQTQLMYLIEKFYNAVKGKYLFIPFKPLKDDFIKSVNAFAAMMNTSSTLAFFIDTGHLTIIREDEMKGLLEFKRKMSEKGIELGVIVRGPWARRIVNIFDSIKPFEDFCVCETELEAVMKLSSLEDSFIKFK